MMNDLERLETRLARLEAKPKTPGTDKDIQQVRGELDEMEADAMEDWTMQRDRELGRVKDEAAPP
jgi:hypothetical protein